MSKGAGSEKELPSPDDPTCWNCHQCPGACQRCGIRVDSLPRHRELSVRRSRYCLRHVLIDWNSSGKLLSGAVRAERFSVRETAVLIRSASEHPPP
jgi:hypothetical protein